MSFLDSFHKAKLSLNKAKRQYAFSNPKPISIYLGVLLATFTITTSSLILTGVSYLILTACLVSRRRLADLNLYFEALSGLAKIKEDKIVIHHKTNHNTRTGRVGASLISFY